MTKEKPKPPRPPPAADAKPAPPAAPTPSAKQARAQRPTGRVQFDDRGNAIWEWSIATGSFGRDLSSGQLKKHEHPGLSIADDAPTPANTVKPNPLGAVRGYDPYDSGQIGKAQTPPRKKDLRKLGDWIALRKRAADKKGD